MKKETTYVIGHKNPDTDSISSAIGLAELKRAEGFFKNIHAARAGDLNPQTAFILDHFDVEPPIRLLNVFPKAGDIMSEAIISVTEDTPILDVMEKMREKKIRFVPVLDREGIFKGALTLMDVAQMYMEKTGPGGARPIKTNLTNITKTLGAEVVLDCMEGKTGTFHVYVGAMAEESFINIISFADPGDCIVIVGDRSRIQLKAIEMGVALLVVSGGMKVSNEVKAAARAKGVSLIISPFDSASTALFTRLSTPASDLCMTEFETAAPDDLADDLTYRLTAHNGLVVLDEGRLRGIVTKTDLISPSKTNLILVDHNELSQAVDGADKVNILQVVDHHRIGNFNSDQAIPFICEPLGATSSIVAELYQRSALEIDKKIASLLLAGVVSDTVILKSPTTTARDIKIVKWLEEKSGLNHAELGATIFSATSSIKKRGPRKVVESDHKTFEVKSKSFGIGQVETIGFSEFYEEKEELTEELKRVAREKRLVLSAMLITDIVLGTSLLLATGEKKVLFNLGYRKLDDGLFELKDVISRKKQVVPHILSVFNEIY